MVHGMSMRLSIRALLPTSQAILYYCSSHILFQQQDGLHAGLMSARLVVSV
jgi:hypothetical protein